MAIANAKYFQEYDNGEVLSWPCVVEDISITEFHAQASGTPFDSISSWATLVDEWVIVGGHRMNAVKNSEFEDAVVNLGGGSDGYDMACEEYGDFVVFDDADIPDTPEMF